MNVRYIDDFLYVTRAHAQTAHENASKFRALGVLGAAKAWDDIAAALDEAAEKIKAAQPGARSAEET